MPARRARAHTPMLLQQVVCPILVGREPELHALQELVERSLAGRGEVVFVGGDAGIGKSRLCRELKRLAAARGMRVVEGRCVGGEASAPYGPFMDALRFRLLRGEASVATQVLGPMASHLAPLLPELAGGASQEQDAGEIERPFEAIHRVLERLAGLGPIVLFLEDLHWADPTSRELLHFLAHRIRSTPLLIVATYRADELHHRHPLRRLIATLTAERLAREVLLGPLGEREVARMVAAILGGEPESRLVAAIRERTEGNPFFVEELLKGLADAGRLHPETGAADLEEAALPSTVRDTVLGRLEPLGERTFEVLCTAAVIGRQFDFDLLQEVSGLAEEELLPVIEQLVRQQVLVEERGSGAECLAFRHVLMKEVLYEHVLARRRRLIHRRVAAALEGRSPSQQALKADVIAAHYAAGGDDVRARAFAVRAGDQAARLYAWEEAEMRYERALASLEKTDPDPPLEAEVLEKLAYATWWQGRAESTLQYVEEALRLRRTLAEPAALASTLRHFGLLHVYLRGDWRRGAAAIEEALALLQGIEEGGEHARAMNDLGRVYLGAGRFEEAEAWLERGRLVSERVGKPAEVVFADAKLGLLRVLRGEVAAGLDRLDAARAQMAGIAMPLDRATGVYYAGIRGCELARENARAVEWIDLAAAYCERHGVAANFAINDAFRAAVERRHGRCGDALVLATRAVDALRLARRVELREALRVLGDLYRVRGDLQAARRAYDEALQLGDRECELGLAQLALGEGRPGDAADRLENVVARVPAAHRLLRAAFLAAGVEACVAAERFATAFEFLDALDECVAATDHAAGPPLLAHATGLVAAASGDVDLALARLDEAVSGWERLAQPLEHARSLAELAITLVATGRDAERGASLGRDALIRFEAAGAAGEAARLRRRLRRTGLRVRARAAGAGQPTPLRGGHAHQLTAREVEVLAQLVTGRTNKEIAVALGIAEKTVSIHVSHILGKLGCATRTQAAGVALSNRLLAASA